MQNTLVKNFKNFLFREELFSGGEKLVVGISGGADSVGLVRLLLAVEKKFDLQLHLVHINYNLRGEDSKGDENFVRDFAKEYNLTLDVINYKEGLKKGKNLEEYLRDFRYEQFEKIRDEKNFDWTIVAHHQDDQIETFLINLFRGAGVDGLKGMLIKDQERRIIRPALNFSKKDIIEFLEATGQNWREDHTNRENVFLRNKIRNILIPIIEKEYSPQFKQKVANMTTQLQKYFSLTNIIVEDEMKTVIKTKNKGGVVVDVKKYLALDSGLRALVFRKIIKEINGNLKNISQGNYFEFEKIMKSEKGKNQMMTIGDLRFERIENEVRLFDKKRNK